MAPKKQNRKQRPRNKNPKPILTPHNPDPVPAWMAEVLDELPFNPTSPPLGTECTINDVDHALDKAQIDEIAARDMYSWHAVDVILNEIVEAYPTGVEPKKRIALARMVLFGEGHRGPTPTDDGRILMAIAEIEVRDQIIKRLQPRDISELIDELTPPSMLSNLNESERKTLHTRLRRKYKKHRQQLLAEVTAYFHPSQQTRWQHVQEVLRLLRLLKILPSTN